MAQMLEGCWYKLLTDEQEPEIKRSSHSVAIAHDKIYIFGGEIIPRTPVDNTTYIYNLQTRSWEVPIPSSDSAPSPRVGCSSVSIGENIYIFGGRGGKSMSPLPSDVFELNTKMKNWSKLLPLGKEVPEPRSYHCMTASETHFYIFGGCPAQGRVSDFWSFEPSSCVWTRLQSAPVSGRGGACMTYVPSPTSQGKIYLFGGFNGAELDDLLVYDIAQGQWSEPLVRNATLRPPARSVHGQGLVGKGRVLVIYGEKDPSLVGHEGAGKFWDDVWALDIYENNEVEWRQVHLKVSDKSGDGDVVKPNDRGWFQVAPWNNGIVLSGGLDAENARLSDLYLLEIA